MAPNYYKSPIGCGHNLLAVNLVAFCTILAAHNTVITQYEFTLVLIAVVLYVIIAQKFETLET